MVLTIIAQRVNSNPRLTADHKAASGPQTEHSWQWCWPQEHRVNSNTRLTADHEAACGEVFSRGCCFGHLVVIHPPGTGDHLGIPCCTVANGHSPRLIQRLGGHWLTCCVRNSLMLMFIWLNVNSKKHKQIHWEPHAKEHIHTYKYTVTHMDTHTHVHTHLHTLAHYTDGWKLTLSSIKLKHMYYCRGKMHFMWINVPQQCAWQI